MSNCKQCQSPFEITDQDRQFYQKIDVPEPTLCHPCRHQRLILQVNQVNLFKRKCDATGEPVIAQFPADSPYKVYSQKYWYSDAFDSMEYGRDFDFSRPFFEQYQELSLAVPRPALLTTFLTSHNSDYVNYAGANKNCYLIFDSDLNEDCYHSYGINSCKNIADCFRVDMGVLDYENTDTKNCYNCQFVNNSENCSDSIFLSNCIGVKNSIMCSNLQRKEFHVNNQPVSPEEFAKIRDSLKDRKVLEQAKEVFKKFKLKFPQKAVIGMQNENVSGNYLVGCKNARECYDCREVWDGKYLIQSFMKTKDCMDCDQVGDSELAYMCADVGYNSYNTRFCMNSINQIANLTYCDYTFHSSDLFGCVGLKGKKHCILNKQYDSESYVELMEKIIGHMKKTGEWGEFFPASTSLAPYNLSMAQDYYPLTKEEALRRGFVWRDADPIDYQSATASLPDSIADVPDSIVRETLVCLDCGRNYKIIAPELALYRRWNLPPPTACFFCRHLARLHSRNPRKLWDRNCAKCQKAIQTTYAPDRPEIVYCESCYLKEVY